MIPGIDLKQIFHGVSAGETVIVAVSGGSDSIALLLLSAAWAKTVDVDIQVVTIDHGLRPEAAAEAAFVAGVSEGLDLPHITLAWDGIKPRTGVSSAARDARYRLMEEFANDIGAKTILVGHTADDQAETVLMRNARVSSYSPGRGLSGMSRIVQLPQGSKLIRPLLGIRRDELRKYLKDLNQSWIEDPSNDDESYERVRIRRLLKRHEITVPQICRFASLMARERKLLAGAVTEFLMNEVKISEGPVYQLKQDTLEKLPRGQRIFAVQVLAAIAGGGEQLVSPASVIRLFDFPTEPKMTMGNSIFERYRETLRIYREKRNLPGILVAPDETAIWDGRLLIRNKSNTTYYCGPMEGAQIADAEIALGRKLSVRPRVVLGGTPFMNGDGEDFCLPFLKGFPVPPGLQLSLCCPAIEHFCPEQDAELLRLLDWIRTTMKNVIHHK